MPSSDYNSIAKVLQVVERLQPRFILDVGVGNGRYGFLFRELLDWNYGRFTRDTWQAQIDGVEIDSGYVQDHQRCYYNQILLGDFNAVELPTEYDLIFFGDVLEHFPNGIWQQALDKARKASDVTLVSAPNHSASILQGAWMGHESERHQVVLTPRMVGGRCLYATSKWFLAGFDNRGIGVLDRQDVCL